MSDEINVGDLSNNQATAIDRNAKPNSLGMSNESSACCWTYPTCVHGSLALSKKLVWAWARDSQKHPSWSIVSAIAACRTWYRQSLAAWVKHWLSLCGVIAKPTVTPIWQKFAPVTFTWRWLNSVALAAFMAKWVNTFCMAGLTRIMIVIENSFGFWFGDKTSLP